MEGLFQESFISNQKKEHEIHIHLLRPDQIKGKDYNCLLDGMEKLKSQSFIFAKDRALYRASHIFLRQILSCYESVPPAEWQFYYDNFGKPTIRNPQYTDLKFNLSHTHSLIACAVGYRHNLGVDVERHKPLDNFADMCRLVLSEQERVHLFSLVSQQQQQFFFRYWTLKEACLKAIGKGLTVPLHSIQYDTHSELWRCIVDKDIGVTGKLHAFYHTLPEANYFLALAMQMIKREPMPQIHLFDWREATTTITSPQSFTFNVLPG